MTLYIIENKLFIDSIYIDPIYRAYRYIYKINKILKIYMYYEKY